MVVLLAVVLLLLVPRGASSQARCLRARRFSRAVSGSQQCKSAGCRVLTGRRRAGFDQQSHLSGHTAQHRSQSKEQGRLGSGGGDVEEEAERELRACVMQQLGKVAYAAASNKPLGADAFLDLYAPYTIPCTLNPIPYTLNLKA